MHTKKGRQATWNLIQCGLDSTCMESLTATVHLCVQGLEDTPVFYWPFVQRVLSKDFVDKHLRKGGVAMATALLRLASKALVCRASMELPGTAATLLQDTIVHVICAGVTYHMAHAEEFLSEVVHVSALFTGWYACAAIVSAWRPDPACVHVQGLLPAGHLGYLLSQPFCRQPSHL